MKMAKPVKKYWKFLAGNLKSNYSGQQEFYYPSPTPVLKDGEVTWKPSRWVTVPDAPVNGEACGVGLHLMKVLKPIYGRYTGNCYEAEGKGKCGEDAEKARFKSIRLIKPVNEKEIFQPKADLSGANLSRANLYGAQLLEGALAPEQLKQIITPYGDLVLKKAEDA